MRAPKWSLLFLIAAAVFLSAQLGNADDTASIRSFSTLWVCGDSTAANGRDRGWASHLQEFFDPTKLRVVNRARGGCSSRTFLMEGLWDAMLADVQPGDFVVIQFGHNDGGPLDRDRARGSLRGVGDESRDVTVPNGKHESVHTYGWYLRKFVSDARAHHATPIIASPVVRNDWREGKVIRAQGYPIWSAEISRAEKCPFVDASNIIADRYDAMGEAVVKPLFPEEHTHTSADGAALNAELIVAGLKSLAGGPFDEFLSARGKHVTTAAH